MDRIISIAIVDDEVLFAEGISRILTEQEGFHVDLIASDGQDFLEKLQHAAELPDVALIDVRMKPMNGFDTVKALSVRFPSVKCVILSSYYEEAFIGHMVELGVTAFLPKNSRKEELASAIRQVHTNGVYFSENDHLMLRRFIQQKSASIYFRTTDQLSPREIEVLGLICQEHTNQQIADMLFLSKRTVESHRLRMIEKLGVKNTAGLVVYAITQQLYKPDLKYYT